MLQNVFKWSILVLAFGAIAISAVDVDIASYFKTSASVERKEVVLEPFSLPDLSGNDLSSTKLMSGDKGILVHFWATTCAPCILELPSITKMAREWHDAPVATLFVSVMDSKKQIERFLRKTGIDTSGLHMVRDGESLLMNQLGTVKIPETYLFSSEGKLIKKFVGAQEWSRELIEAYL